MKVNSINQEIVEVIYDVPLGDSSWKEVVHLLKKEFNVLVCFMLVIDPKQKPIIISTIAHDHDLWKSYDEYYYNVDPWNEILISGQVGINTCFTGQSYNLYKKDQCYFETEYYNDFWKPHGLYHTGGGFLVTRNNVSIVLGFPREKIAGPYNAYEAQMMTFYARQIVRAIELEGIFGHSLPKQVYSYSLSASYGLSAAESRLVLELFKHGSLPEASNSLNRSYHTVRNQMKSILSKTETTNQLELFKLLVSPCT